MASDPSDDKTQREFALACPIPRSDYPNILLGHGGGGKLTWSLIAKIFAPAFANPLLDAMHDGAVLELGAQRIAYSGHGYV